MDKSAAFMATAWPNSLSVNVNVKSFFENVYEYDREIYGTLYMAFREMYGIIYMAFNVSEYVEKYTALFLAEGTSRAPNGVDVKRMKGHQD